MIKTVAELKKAVDGITIGELQKEIGETYTPLNTKQLTALLRIADRKINEFEAGIRERLKELKIRQRHIEKDYDLPSLEEFSLDEQIKQLERLLGGEGGG